MHKLRCNGTWGKTTKMQANIMIMMMMIQTCTVQYIQAEQRFYNVTEGWRKLHFIICTLHLIESGWLDPDGFMERIRTLCKYYNFIQQSVEIPK